MKESFAFLKTMLKKKDCVVLAISGGPDSMCLLDLILSLKEEYDLIVIDGTPSKLVTDSVILSRIVDSTIIVAAHNITKKEELAKIVRDIKNVGGNVAGVVYNQKPFSSKKTSETYYYAPFQARIGSKGKIEMDYKQSEETEQNSDTDMPNQEQ